MISPRVQYHQSTGTGLNWTDIIYLLEHVNGISIIIINYAMKKAENKWNKFDYQRPAEPVWSDWLYFYHCINH